MATTDRAGIIDHGKSIALGSPKELIPENNIKYLEEVSAYLFCFTRLRSGVAIQRLTLFAPNPI